MSTSANATQKQRINIGRIAISVICTLFFCRRYFSEVVSESIDSGWVWALNRAIRDGKTFGSEFVFTYGPLGFLSTRYTQYTGTWPLLLGDVLLAAGFFYFVFRRLPFTWGSLAVTLCAVILLRNAYTAQALFSLFFIYMSLIYTARRQDAATLVFAALYAVMLFFVKANYGIIVPVCLVAAMGLLLARRQWVSLLWLVIPLAVFSTVMLVVFPVHVRGYIIHGLALVAGYEEAMFLPVDVHSPAYNAMIFFVGISFLLAAVFLVRLARLRQLNAGHFIYLCFFCVSVFLVYKNGITRFDAQHTEQFMAVFPFLFLVAGVVAGHGHRPIVLVVASVFICTSFAVTVRKTRNLAELAGEAWSLASVHGYYSTVLKPSQTLFPPHLLLDEEKKRQIAGGTVDIIPHEIYVAAANGLDYNGRPVCQSYSVYKPSLDSINAGFFAAAGRPARVLISGSVVDPGTGAYRGFYEPRTHASIHLNYSYETTTLPTDSVPAGNNDYFVVFRSGGGAQRPQFSVISQLVCKLNDTVSIPAGSQPVYMSAGIKYTTMGAVNKLLRQPMPIWITLYMEDGRYYDYRLQLSMLQSPVLISRLLTSSREMWYFLSGREQEARKIKSFRISTHNREIEQNIKLAFYSFDNYRHADQR